MPRHVPVSRAAHRVRAGVYETLDDLERAASTCELCRLCRERTLVVTGTGPTDADVLVVAEAPGYHEDREGRLLAKASGELFNAVLAEAGLTRNEIFLTSVVKCRPPTGRTPFPDEVEACEGWLFREIALVQPSVVVTLGSLALRLITGRREQIRDVHGEMIHANLQGRDVVVWPLVHPAAALHVSSLTTQLHADARALGALLRGARAARPAAPAPAPDAAPPPVVDEQPQPDPATDLPPDEPQLTMDV